MHEASLLNDLMRKISNIAAEQNALRVTKVSVWVGAMSHMSASHFRDHFVQASCGSVADGADLEVTVDDDIHNDNAQDILLRNIEVDVEE